MKEKKVFGFDIGTASIGWAVINPELINEYGELTQAFKIVKSGVRLFDEPVVAKTKEPLNIKRREKRLSRRRNARKVRRLNLIKNLLIQSSLVAKEDLTHFIDNEENKNHIFITKKGELSPYELRKKALEEKLTNQELAKILFHMAKYRGFKSTKKEEKKYQESQNKSKEKNDSEKEKEELGKVLKASDDNKKELEEKNFQTMNELILDRAKNKITSNIHNKGGDYSNSIIRSYVQEEAEKIFAKQSSFFPNLVDIKEKYLQIAFEQRPLKDFEVGICTIFNGNKDINGKDIPREKRAPKSSPTVEYFIALTRLSNLKINKNNKETKLTSEEIKNILSQAKETKEVTYDHVRNIIKLDAKDFFYGLKYGDKIKSKKNSKKKKTEDENPENVDLNKINKEAEKKKLIAFPKYQELKKILGNSFENFSDKDLDIIAEALTYKKQENKIRKYLEEKDLTISNEDFDKIKDLDFTMVINFSHKALYEIVPIMEQMLEDGEIDTSKAIEKAIQEGKLPNEDKTSKLSGKLPPLKEIEDREDVPKSPVVIRAISEFRKVFNALVDTYGKPDECHFEMLRELLYKDAKDNKTKKSDEEEQANLQAKAKKEELGCDLISAKLCIEQKEECPYCQNKISPSDVGKNTEIDHIIPYSWSFDDSYANKVLVHAQCNQNKGQQTPYMKKNGQNNSEEWNKFKNYVLNHFSSSRKKRNNLLSEKNKEEILQGFTDRQLNESAYIARFIKNYVEKYFNFDRTQDEHENKRKVFVIKGFTTNFMRNIYSLNKYRGIADYKNHESRINKYQYQHASHQELESKRSSALAKAKENWIGDRHHAVDAILVAIADSALIQKIHTIIANATDYNAKNRADSYLQKYFKKPENSIIKGVDLPLEIKKSLESIFISKRPEIKYSGAIHEETIYGTIKLKSLKPIGDNPSKENIIDGEHLVVTQRKSIKDITLKDIIPNEKASPTTKPANLIPIGHYTYEKAILTDTARKAIELWLKDKSINKNEAGIDFPYFTDKHGNKTIIRNYTIITNKKIDSMYKLTNTDKFGNKQEIGYVDQGDVIRTDIFRSKNKKDEYEYFIRPISFADLTIENKVPLGLGADRSLKYPEGDDVYEFMFSLHSKELFRYTEHKKGEEPITSKNLYYIGYDLSANSVEYKYHCSSLNGYKITEKEDEKDTKITANPSRMRKGITSLKKLEKVTIDVLGREISHTEKEEYVCPLQELKKFQAQNANKKHEKNYNFQKNNEHHIWNNKN